ncbi:hypothetical protein ACJZ2D_003764 [Fusarium nematophilum]
MKSLFIVLGGLLVCLHETSAACVSNGTALPVVDLGYELHQATNYDQDRQTYDFSNIRYAAPPVGDLRFAPPAAPAVNRSAIQANDQARMCPQAIAEWLPASMEESLLYVFGQNASLPPTSTAPNTVMTEDCLFLDVSVPRKIFEGARSGIAKAPVLVWIYGGGYASGAKAVINGGLPGGLLERGGNDFIYVALNYRLGAFGFLGGPLFEASGGVPNAGLLDQRFALEWMQRNIHMFGGDPGRVTVMGESAGGGSILYQITAFGGLKGPAPFQQAILQSPATAPSPLISQQDQAFRQFLEHANVSSLDEARAASSSVLMAANYEQIFNSPTGSFTYSPVIDGAFIPNEPSLLLSEGKFDTSVRVMVGSNTRDGLYFGDFSVLEDASYRQWLSRSLPGVGHEMVEYIATELYPPVYDGSFGYTDQITRTAATVQDFYFQCNGPSLAWALQNATYHYEFAVPPAFHALDIPYTFFDGNASTVTSPKTAVVMQEYLTKFTIYGMPYADDLPAAPLYGDGAALLVLNTTGASLGQEAAALAKRCVGRNKVLSDIRRLSDA